jgi:hypothetical protein
MNDVQSVNCWSCKQAIVVTESNRGMKIRCPKCGTKQRMPKSDGVRNVTSKGVIWTDDLSITVAPEYTLEQLVEFILESSQRNTQRDKVMHALTNTFGLSFEDARLAVDRVDGGQVRAETQNPANVPDPAKDPIAYISYQRARGAPPPISRSIHTNVWQRLISILAHDLGNATDYVSSKEFLEGSASHEREAATLWRLAISAASEGAKPASSSSVALCLLCLAETMTGIKAEININCIRNVLLQVGVAIDSVGESRIVERGDNPHVLSGTPAWFDAIRLSEAASRLSTLYSEIGDGQYESRALYLRAKLVTHLLGHCYDRVGIAMLEHAQCERRLGHADRAADLCVPVVSDLARLVVERCEDEGSESDDEPLEDEDEIALRKVIEAIDLLGEIRGGNASEIQNLRTRCSSLLKRNISGQQVPVNPSTMDRSVPVYTSEKAKTQERLDPHKKSWISRLLKR